MGISTAFGRSSPSVRPTHDMAGMQHSIYDVPAIDVHLVALNPRMLTTGAVQFPVFCMIRLSVISRQRSSEDDHTQRLHSADDRIVPVQNLGRDKSLEHDIAPIQCILPRTAVSYRWQLLTVCCV